jgi:Circularly permutated YpsA SLOG family
MPRRGEPTGGTDLTRRLAKRHGKPHRVVDLSGSPNVAAVRRWLVRTKPQALNVAGPRESQNRGIAAEAAEFLRQLFSGKDA